MLVSALIKQMDDALHDIVWGEALLGALLTMFCLPLRPCQDQEAAVKINDWSCEWQIGWCSKLAQHLVFLQVGTRGKF